MANTRNISVTAEQNTFIAKSIASGRYQNASEVVRDALRALVLRQADDDVKLKQLNALLQDGIDAAERGDYIALQRHEIRDWVKSRDKRQKAARRAKPAVRRRAG